MFNRTALYSLEMANWQWKACFKHSDYRYAYSKNGELRQRTCQIMNSTSCKYIKFIRTDFSNNLFRCDFYIDVHISVSVCVRVFADWKCTFYIINSNINIWIIELTICSSQFWNAYFCGNFISHNARTISKWLNELVNERNVAQYIPYIHSHINGSLILDFVRQTFWIKVKHRAHRFHSNSTEDNCLKCRHSLFGEWFAAFLFLFD